MPGTYGQASMGTELDDGLRTGAVKNPQYTLNAGILNVCIADPNLNGPLNNNPVTIPVATTIDNLFAANTLANAGYVTLAPANGSHIVTITNYNSASTSFQGATVYDLGIDRVIGISCSANTAAFNATFYGFDRYNNPVGETRAFAGGANAGTVISQKAYRYLYRLYIDAGTANNISVGTFATLDGNGAVNGDTFGLPFATATFDTIPSAFFNQALLTNAAFTAADATSPATATTGDVRGTLTTANAAVNNRLVVYQSLPSNQPPTATQSIAGRYGVPQFIPALF